MIEKMMEENEKTSAPHKVGIKLPMVDPINIPSHMSDFEFITVIFSHIRSRYVDSPYLKL